MTQPVNFGFGEEEAMLRDSAARFFADNLPVERLHALVAADPDPHKPLEAQWRPELWQQMVDLGWTALAVPEVAGGVGLGAVAVVALCEQAGRAAFPSPLLATLNATYVLAACDTAAARQALEAIAGGAAVSLAVLNKAGEVGVDIGAGAGAGTGSGTDTGADNRADTHIDISTGVRAAGDTLSGTAHFVQDAQKVGHFVVLADNGPHDNGLYWVDAKAAGVALAPDAIVDLTRDQARVHFDNTPATRLTDSADNADNTKGAKGAAAALQAALPAIWTLVAADMVGAAEWQLQTTAEYAKTRKQFDRALGFFQAIKHPLVNVMVEIDQSRSLVYNAACAIDTEPERARLYALMAKSSASDMAQFASSRAVQFHGGIGFTWECFLHLYFKRQMHNQALWGDAIWHRARMADLIIG